MVECCTEPREATVTIRRSVLDAVGDSTKPIRAAAWKTGSSGSEALALGHWGETIPNTWIGTGGVNGQHAAWDNLSQPNKAEPVLAARGERAWGRG